MVDIDRVRSAMEVVGANLCPTPVLLADHFSKISGAEVYLKLENLQRTGSFKIRGALNKLARCRDRIGPKGVVAASAGNHAQGVALAAQRLGVSATVVMPENAPISKQLATRDYGGKVILAGATVADALDHAKSLLPEGYTFVHPFDDEEVVAGQGTVGLELLDQVPALDEIWVPVGGGGLASGIAAAVKALRPEVVVVGVQTEACPSAVEALRAGRPVTVPSATSIADGILVPRVGEVTLPLLVRWVDRIETVAETRIAMAVVQLLHRKKLLAEGAGVAALAALLGAADAVPPGRRVAVVISGGNVDLNTLDRILEQGLIRTGRILRFRVVLDDVPGALTSILSVLSGLRANILHISHDRLGLDLPVGRTRVEVSVETRNFEHIDEILGTLETTGFDVDRHLTW